MSHRIIATAFSALVILITSVTSDPVRAEWTAAGSDASFSEPMSACTDFINRYFSGMQFLRIYFNYNQQGAVIGANCDWQRANGQLVTTPVRVKCPSGEYPTSSRDIGWCAQKPPKAGEPQCRQKVGNPIDVVTGNKFERVTDFTTAGPYKLEFTRYYNGNDYDPTEFGAGWRSSFSRSFVQGSTKQYTRIVLEDGTEALFYKVGSNYRPAYRITGTQWGYPRKDVSWSLEEKSTGWEFTNTDGRVDVYDSSKRLIAIRYLNGYIQSIARDSDGRVSAVTDNFGRTINFGYIGTVIPPLLAAAKSGAKRPW